MEQQQQHYLLVSYRLQSHINPVLHLAKTLTRAGELVTFSTTVSSHRLMFPDTPTSFPLDDPTDPLLTYHPYSDGYDDGFDPAKDSFIDYMSHVKVIGQETLRAVAGSPGRPAVTCVVYSLVLPWVPDFARQLGVPSVIYWIQSASAFAVYYHYIYGYRELIESHSSDPSYVFDLPGLPPLRPRDLPSLLVRPGSKGPLHKAIISTIEETCNQIVDKKSTGTEEDKPRVLVNSFLSLERDAISATKTLELVPIGPVLPSACLGGEESKDTGFSSDLIKHSDGRGYMEWLDQWAEKSVVYVSFGSITVLGKNQKAEVARALAGSDRPFLWVVRGEKGGAEEAEAAEKGKVLGWCNQLSVLSHSSVGCFVTHCGWNSTLESLACGVPMVGMPQWMDQPLNAKVSEAAWGVGVRAAVNEEGVVEGEELRRCLEVVMAETDEGAEIRRRAATWKQRARDAVREGGPSERSLRSFMGRMTLGAETRQR